MIMILQRNRAEIFIISGVFLACNSVFSDNNKNEIKKPNMVLIIADDVSAEDLGCYGNKGIKTPNIDALAKSGVNI